MTKSYHPKHVTDKPQQNFFKIPSHLVPPDSVHSCMMPPVGLRHEGVALKHCSDGIYEPEESVLSLGGPEHGRVYS